MARGRPPQRIAAIKDVMREKLAETKEALAGRMMTALEKDFKAHGEDAIVKMREKNPDKYVQMCVSVFPKEQGQSAAKMDLLIEALENIAINSMGKKTDEMESVTVDVRPAGDESKALGPVAGGSP